MEPPSSSTRPTAVQCALGAERCKQRALDHAAAGAADLEWGNIHGARAHATAATWAARAARRYADDADDASELREGRSTPAHGAAVRAHNYAVEAEGAAHAAHEDARAALGGDECRRHFNPATGGRGG